MKTNKPKDYEKIHYWLRKNFGSPKVCENTECEHLSNTYDWALKQGFEYQELVDLIRSKLTPASQDKE